MVAVWEGSRPTVKEKQAPPKNIGGARASGFGYRCSIVYGLEVQLRFHVAVVLDVDLQATH